MLRASVVMITERMAIFAENFSDDDFGTYKIFFDFFMDKSLANGLQIKNITLDKVQDDVKCTETVPEVLRAMILPPAVMDNLKIYDCPPLKINAS